MNFKNARTWPAAALPNRRRRAQEGGAADACADSHSAQRLTQAAPADIVLNDQTWTALRIFMF
jgi:hypothetical protein